jgi:hypothetical protein
MLLHAGRGRPRGRGALTPAGVWDSAKTRQTSTCYQTGARPTP